MQAAAVGGIEHVRDGVESGFAVLRLLGVVFTVIDLDRCGEPAEVSVLTGRRSGAAVEGVEHWWLSTSVPARTGIAPPEIVAIRSPWDAHMSTL